MFARKGLHCIHYDELTVDVPLGFLDSIEIPADFHEWAMKVLREQNAKESKDRENIITNQRKEYDKVLKKLDNMIDLRAAGEITEDEFARRREALTMEKNRLEELIKDSHQNVDRWLETVDSYFTFAEKARSAFSNGTLEVRKGILSALGSNLTLKDKKLNVCLVEPLVYIKKSVPEVRAIHEQVRTSENPEKQKDFGHFYAQSPMLLRMLEEVRTEMAAG